jgi:hypothetical protein
MIWIYNTEVRSYESGFFVFFSYIDDGKEKHTAQKSSNRSTNISAFDVNMDVRLIRRVT